MQTRDITINSITTAGGMEVIDNKGNARVANLTVTGSFNSAKLNAIALNINTLLAADVTVLDAISAIQTSVNNLPSSPSIQTAVTSSNAVLGSTIVGSNNSVNLTSLDNSLANLASGTTLTGIQSVIDAHVSTLATSSAVATLQSTAKTINVNTTGLATAAQLATMQTMMNNMQTTLNAILTKVNTL